MANSAGTVAKVEDIQTWITRHAGMFDREVQKWTTHLICSVEAYKARDPQGKFSVVAF